MWNPSGDMSYFAGFQLLTGATLYGSASRYARFNYTGAGQGATGYKRCGAGEYTEQDRAILIHLGLAVTAAEDKLRYVVRVLAQRLGGGAVSIAGHLLQICCALQQNRRRPMIDWRETSLARCNLVKSNVLQYLLCQIFHLRSFPAQFGAQFHLFQTCEFAGPLEDF